MAPITVTFPPMPLSDDQFVAAVADMRARLTAAGVPADRQGIDLAQQPDRTWLLTGSEIDAWWL